MTSEPHGGELLEVEPQPIRLVENVRALVRPVVTFGLTGALILAAFVDVEAVEHVREPALIVVGFWFGQRIGNGLSSNPPA